LNRLSLRLLLVGGGVVAVASILVAAALATPRGTNGQIAFARFNPALGDTQVWVVNPDGSGEHLVQASTDAGECPKWSPDGSRISTCGDATGGVTRLINPDDGSYRIVPSPDATLFLPCAWWSDGGARLVCETFGLDDPSRNGLYSLRSSDGGDLTRITSNRGGDDAPGDTSPDGKKVVFVRSDADGNNLGMFVVNTNGGGLKQIMPAGTRFSSFGGWSPQGNEIVFSQHVTADVHSSIWVVHTDGTGLHEVDVAPANTCGGLNADPSAKGCFAPSWSPDGTKIVFARGFSGDVDADIYTVNPDGSGLTQVTHDGIGAADPDWGIHPVTG
jgi:TolB protein